MGYTTDFTGKFTVSPSLNANQVVVLKDFVSNRHEGNKTDYPGIWCDWWPTEDGTAIHWNGSEKFYNYIEWIKYLIKEFIIPWGCVLDGEVQWSGEDPSDLGVIRIKNNKVTIGKAEITYKFSEDEEEDEDEEGVGEFYYPYF